MKICVAGQATPVAWMPHLVSAFQERAEVITVGPVPTKIPPGCRLDNWPPPNHIDVDLGSVRSLFDVLPCDWVPDLVVTISGGGIPLLTSVHDLPCPAVFYSVDTWQCYMDYREALHYDIVFTGQRAFVPLLRATGSRHVFWLPLACNPIVHRPLNCPQVVDIGFVGGTSEPVHWHRCNLLAALQTRFSVEAHDGLYGEEMRDVFGRCRLAFNHAAVDDLNMRVFEALAMGRTLLTNRISPVSGLEDFFESGDHLVLYDTEEDLLQQAGHYLQNDAERQRIGAAGRALVLREHTYAHRVDALLERVAELMPGFPNHYENPRRMTFLPRIPGRVLDLGMGLHTSKYAIAQQGVREFVGCTADVKRFEQRKGSYHVAVSRSEDLCRDSFDTVVSNASAIGNAFGLAYDCLVPGGTLVVTHADSTPEIARAMSGHNFHIVREVADPMYRSIVVSRKRIRRLHSIAVEVCQRLKVPGVDAERVSSLIHPDW